MLDALSQLGTNASFSLEYVGKFDPDGTLTSMHGEPEVLGDIAQVCAAKVAPHLFLAMIVCQNANQSAVDTNWQQCAAQVGIPVAPLVRCVRSDEGLGLLADSFRRSENRGVHGTPTIMIAGKKYEGRRTPGALLRTICGEFTSVKPPVCLALPEDPKVRVTILTDRRCPDCDASRLGQMLRARISNPEIVVKDYNDPEGRTLYDTLHPGALPVIVFDETLDADPEARQAFESGVSRQGAFRVSSTHGEWLPACHDDKGCLLPGCKDQLFCRKETPRKIEMFAMSHCPFAARRVQELRDVVAKLPGVTANVQFIGTGDVKNGFDSMHGADEVLEDLRQVCAFQHYRGANKFLDYLACRGASMRNPDWKACTMPKTVLDAGVIQRCAEGPEGKRLLEASFKLSQRLGIGASPTFLVNDKFMFIPADSDAIRKQICDHNKGLAGCPTEPRP
jgi:hypothetical protein